MWFGGIGGLAEVQSQHKLRLILKVQASSDPALSSQRGSRLLVYSNRELDKGRYLKV